jgi:hypothetical protein
MNAIDLNSTKYNQTGHIRNFKFAKSIKSELINHRPSYLEVNEEENKSRSRLFKQKREERDGKWEADLKARYDRQLR